MARTSSGDSRAGNENGTVEGRIRPRLCQRAHILALSPKPDPILPLSHASRQPLLSHGCSFCRTPYLDNDVDELEMIQTQVVKKDPEVLVARHQKKHVVGGEQVRPNRRSTTPSRGGIDVGSPPDKSTRRLSKDIPHQNDPGSILFPGQLSPFSIDQRRRCVPAGRSRSHTFPIFPIAPGSKSSLCRFI